MDEDQEKGIWSFRAWHFSAMHFAALYAVAREQPTEPVRSGYYRTLFSIEAFNDATAETRKRLQALTVVDVTKPIVVTERKVTRKRKSLERRPASPRKAKEGVVPDAPPRVIEERWAPDPLVEKVARAVDAIWDEARRARRVFHVKRMDAGRSKVAELVSRKVALRRKAAAMLLLAA